MQMFYLDACAHKHSATLAFIRVHLRTQAFDFSRQIQGALRSV